MTLLKKWLGPAALLIALAGVLTLMLAGLGSKWGWWHWGFGLGTLTREWAPKILLAGAILGVAALFLAISIRPRKGIVVSLLAVLLAGGALYQMGQVRKTARDLPFIHDVSTDTENPPMFTDAIMDLRGADSNPADYVGKMDPRGEALVSELQKEAYPEIEPLRLDASVDAVMNEVINTVEASGWEVHNFDEAVGIIEATDTTFWYGFKDDVIIRVQAEGDKTRVDMRSLSRVGGSDLGANAARIRGFMDKLEARF